jgi:hypothetical protein
MHFTLEEEFENKINFLYITISKDDNNIQFNTYRKPTSTDIITPNDLCHPQKTLTTVRYWTKRLSTYRMNNTEKEK